MSRVTVARRKAILREVQKLLRILHERRRELWGSPPGDPLEMIDPLVIATKLLGLRYSEPEEIPSPAGYGRIAGVMDRERRELVVAQRLKMEVRRFTAAHEIGHWLLHPGAQYFRDAPLDGGNRDQERPVEEREADLFAATLLMPESLVRQQFQQHFGAATLADVPLDEHLTALLSFGTKRSGMPLRPSALQTTRQVSKLAAECLSLRRPGSPSLARLFRVSPGAMAIRLEELNLVSNRPGLDREGRPGPEELVSATSLTRTPAPEGMKPRVYEEIIDLIARGGNPSEVIAFRPSEEAHARLDELLTREEHSELTAEEKSELDHYLQLEHIMRMAKARARQYLSSTSIR